MRIDIRSRSLALATWVAACSCLGRSALADQYIYTPTNGATDSWLAGTGWYDATTSTAAAPVSNASTELTFTTDNTTVFPSGFTDTSTNDIASPFLLNTLDLNGTGPATGTATVNIGGSALSPTDQGAINLNANAGSAGTLTYNVSTPLTFGNNNAVFFNGNGTAVFNFSGGFTNTNGGFNIVKNGSSTLTISGASNLSGAVYSLYGGTIRLSGAGTLGSNTGIKFYDSGTTLDLNGTNQTIAYIDLDGNSPGSDSTAFVSGTIENNGTGTSTFTINNEYQPIRQNLVDNTNDEGGVLALTFNNSVTLEATNTYSGLTTINGGTLTVGDGTTNGTLGSGAVLDNSALTFNRSDATYVATNAISGYGSVSQSGSGTVTLSGANTYTGTTYVNSGTLRLGSATALGSTSNGTNVSSGATLDLNGQTIGEALSVYGSGVGSNGALINNASTLATVNANVNNGVGTTFTVGGSGNITINGQIGNNPGNTIDKVGTGTLMITGGGGTDDYALAVDAMAGTVILAKTSDGGTHAIGGGVTTDGGVVQLGGSGGDQIYDGDDVTVNSGAFDTNGQSETFHTLNLTGTGINGAGALVDSAAGVDSSIIPNNNTNLNGTPTIGVTQSSGVLFLNNSINGSSGFTKVGNGNLVLTGNNTGLSGQITLAAGILQYSDSGNQGETHNLGNSSIYLDGGTLLHYTDPNHDYEDNPNLITVDGTVGGSINASGPTNQSPVQNQMGFFTPNTIQGSGPLFVTGGIVRVAASQSYSGVLTLEPSAGFEYNGSGASSGSFVVNGDGMGTQSGSGELIDSSGVTINNTVTVNGGILSFDNGSSGNFANTITLTGSGATVGLRNFYDLGGVTNGLISGAIIGTGGLTVNSGTGSGGTLNLTGANTYTGPTTISGATIQAGVASVPGISGALGVNSALIIANVSNSSLNLAGYNTQIGSLTGGGSNGGVVNLQNATLTVGGDNTSRGPFAGVITGVGSVVKIGAGTLTLNGTNTYGGTGYSTTVTGGTLTVNGAINNANPVYVGDGTNVHSGTLAGGTTAAPGQIQGPVVINSGGTITAGSGATAADSIGTLSTGAETWNAGGQLVAKVAGTTAGITGNDELIMSGLSSVGSNFTVALQAINGSTPTFSATNPSPSGPFAPGSFIVVADDTTTSSTNPFAAILSSLTLVNNGVSTHGGTGSLELETQVETSGTGYDLVVEDDATPEPTSFLLLGLAGAPLIAGRRRKLRVETA